MEIYVSWINDQPMLPDRQVVIDTIRAENKRALELILRLFENLKDKAS